MTNRKIDWGGYKPMSDAEKKCASQQQYTITALLIMTVFNILFGGLMVYGILPVWLGMIASFAMMIAVVYKVQKALLDWDEKMWESAEDFRNRQ